MRKIDNLHYAEDSQSQVLDIYLPEGGVRAVFVYFHGGGLVEGDKGCAEVFAESLTSRGVALVSANYRMYPSARFPDFIRDAARAVEWADRYMRAELGCERLFVGGSSAGGYLSMMLCFDGRYLNEAGLDCSSVSGYFHDAGQPTAHFNLLVERGIDPRRVIIDETAPLYYVGTAEKYPPMRFVVSDSDMPCRYEQTMLLLSTLSHFGAKDCTLTVMHGGHCEYCGKVDNEGRGVLGEMIYSFIGRLI